MHSLTTSNASRISHTNAFCPKVFNVDGTQYFSSLGRECCLLTHVCPCSCLLPLKPDVWLASEKQGGGSSKQEYEYLKHTLNRAKVGSLALALVAMVI